MKGGVDLLLKHLIAFVAENFNRSALLVGREAELPQFLQDLSVKARDRVRYAGFQPPERLPEYFCSGGRLWSCPAAMTGGAWL